MVARLRVYSLYCVPLFLLAVLLAACEWPSRRSSDKVMFRFAGVDKTKLAKAEDDPWAPLDPSGIPRPTGAAAGSLDSYSYRVPERRVLYYTNPFYSEHSNTYHGPWGPVHEEGSYYEEFLEESPYFAVPVHEQNLPDGDATFRFDVQASGRGVTENGDVTSVRVRIAAPDSAAGKDEGLNLAIVLDLSRSLEDPEKRSLSRAAAHHLIDQLMPGDRFSLVVFGADTRVLLSADAAVDRALLHRSIEESGVAGEGNMGAGLLEAFKQVETGLEISGYSGHVILISDGLAGRGGTDVWRFAEMARRMHAQKGIRTSAVALGRMADPAFLSAVAREGEGRFAYIQNVADVREVLGDQLRSMFKTYARNVRLRLKTPPGVEVQGVYGADLRGPLAGVRELPLGEFASGEERSLLFRLAAPPLVNGKRVEVQFFLHFERVAPERRTRVEHKMLLPAGRGTPASKIVDTYARLVIGQDQIRRALESREEVTATTVIEMYEKEFPALKAAALSSGDRDLVRQARRFEHFAHRLQGLQKEGRLQGVSVERDNLVKDFYYGGEP